MDPPDSSPVRRYRRRVLVAGSAVAVLLAAIGLPMYVRGIERDLERRVPAELASSGYPGVTATFSGQDGTLTCDAPLSDPEEALDVAYAVRGVQVVALDRSCRVAVAAVDTESSQATASTTASTTSPTTPVPAGSTVATGFDSLLDVIDSTSNLSILSTLVVEAGLAADLDGAGPFTLFAPSDAAFEALDTDVLARLREDPERLASILRHHLVPGSMPSGELATGTLQALDGTPFDVHVEGGDVTIGGALLVEPDLDAANGVVHVVDRVLVPDGTSLEPEPIEPIVTATRSPNGIALAGTVASDTQSLVLIAAAQEQISPENVEIGLGVDPASPVTDDTAAVLADLIGMVPLALANGQVAYDGTAIYVTGRYIDDGAREALQAAADELGAATELTERPDATVDDVSRLQTSLDDLLAGEPMRFDVGGAELAAERSPLLDRLAGVIMQYGAIVVTAEGHTDSDGDPDSNQELSDERAAAVAEALVARGVPEEQVLSQGFGGTRPIVVAGTEDKDASRRVELRVTLQDG